MENRALPLPDGLDGVRVDAGIAKLFGFSRSFAAEIAEADGVTLDGVVVGKSDKLRAGAWLDVSWQPKQDLVIVPIDVPDLTIVHDDDDIVVINKPSGVAAHPSVGWSGPTVLGALAGAGYRISTSGASERAGIVHDDDDIVVINKPSGVAAHPSVGWSGPTVLGALAGAGYRISTSGASERAGIVHRLDVGTSGLMVVAKSEAAYTHLKRAFHDREVDKIYHAIVQGHPDPSSGTIDAPIGRHPRSDWKFAVVAGGKDSITHYETLEAFPSASLLEVHLETGRTHQIRVHMAAQRHACVGDAMYGADAKISARLGLTRQWLVAKQLSFEHPSSREWVTFDAEYPDDLANALRILRGD